MSVQTTLCILLETVFPTRNTHKIGQNRCHVYGILLRVLEANYFLGYFTPDPVHVETFILANLFKYKLGPATHHKF